MAKAAKSASLAERVLEGRRWQGRRWEGLRGQGGGENEDESGSGSHEFDDSVWDRRSPFVVRQLVVGFFRTTQVVIER